MVASFHDEAAAPADVDRRLRQMIAINTPYERDYHVDRFYLLQRRPLPLQHRRGRALGNRGRGFQLGPETDLSLSARRG